ncbi:Protein kinase alk2 [Puccinia graminis f. sp. tritici]|uniref:Protein kinase alk2 n=1 Tax=Puccinia graminis f. sp. tritici TaxID=56615 RepID=A0A5B0MZF8_PUCGR|nr:Protein kinase alk2 [Puccinia graminis f. sp. tritici]
MALKLRPGFSITVPGVRIIDVSKPEWLEYIQKTNFDNYQKGPMFRGLMVDLFGDGILVTDGALWKRARTVTSRVFSANTFKVRELIDSFSQASCYSEYFTDISVVCFFRM